MTDHPSKNLRIDDARMIFKNFSGAERTFNSLGDRNFSVVLEPLLAQELKAEGWRVKQGKPYGEQEEGDYHLKVTLNYKKGRPPRVIVVTSGNRVEWGIDEVGELDSADIAKVDMVINGWWSDMAGGGYGGYLKTLVVYLNEDSLEKELAGMLSQNPLDRVDPNLEPEFEDA